jgi:hypothetical protein
VDCLSTSKRQLHVSTALLSDLPPLPPIQLEQPEAKADPLLAEEVDIVYLPAPEPISQPKSRGGLTVEQLTAMFGPPLEGEWTWEHPTEEELRERRENPPPGATLFQRGSDGVYRPIQTAS